MQKLKVAVIGTGHLGSIHTRLWKQSAEAELIGVYDVDSEKVNSVASENNCKVFNSLEEVFSSVDAVTIAAPTSLHYEIASAAIKRGRHCLIEKPIADSYSQGKALIELAEERKVLIQVGHVERFNPAIAALKGYKLNPMFIEAHRLSQFKPRATDVSVIHDLMIHDIDIMLWLVKSPVKRIDANCVAVLTDTPDIANARITFENGAVANLTASRISAKQMRKMRLFQQNAYISIDFGKQSVEVFRLSDNGNDSGAPATMLGTIEASGKNKTIYYENPSAPKLNAIAEEQAAFVKAVLYGEPVAVCAEDAAEALRIAEIISNQM